MGAPPSVLLHRGGKPIGPGAGGGGKRVGSGGRQDPGTQESRTGLGPKQT